MNEPKRHHYIPQFILRNFCFDDNNNIHYYNKKTNQVTVEQPRDIFMSRHLYRDEINSPDNPVKIEKDLAEYEREVSEIINGKFLKENEITLNTEEEEKLKLFFAIMAFRAKRTADFFKNGISKTGQKMYSNSQPDGNFSDLWKRNLMNLVNCRSMDDVRNHPDIDDYIKVFFQRDTEGIFGIIFAVVGRKEAPEFVLGDTYPSVVSGKLPNGLELTMYSVFPVSPDRVILMVNNGADNTPSEVLGFRPCILYPPKEKNGKKTIRVKNLFCDEIKQINASIISEAKEGIVFKTLPESSNIF